MSDNFGSVDAAIVKLDMCEEAKVYNYEWFHDLSYRRLSPELTFLKQFDWGTYVPKIHKVLHVGAGAGAGFRYMKGCGFEVHACDIASMLSVDYADMPGRFRVAEAHNLPYATGEFDLVVCCDVLEHTKPQYVLKSFQEIYRVTKSGVLWSVCCAPSNHAAGLHLTVQKPAWWLGAMVQPDFEHEVYAAVPNLICVSHKKVVKNADGPNNRDETGEICNNSSSGGSESIPSSVSGAE